MPQLHLLAVVCDNLLPLAWATNVQRFPSWQCMSMWQKKYDTLWRGSRIWSYWRLGPLAKEGSHSHVQTTNICPELDVNLFSNSLTCTTFSKTKICSCTTTVLAPIHEKKSKAWSITFLSVNVEMLHGEMMQWISCAHNRNIRQIWSMLTH